MLGLQHDTDPKWVEAVEKDLDALLIDHAHCELKAAQSALSLMARYAGEAPILVDPLVALAKEEADHFHQVEERLRARSRSLGMPSSDVYVRDLQMAARRDHADHPALLDRLLLCALIEARSCERFHLLSEHLSSAELRSFYRDLMASEARHYRLFRDLGVSLFGEAETKARLQQLATREAQIAAALPLQATVHG